MKTPKVPQLLARVSVLRTLVATRFLDAQFLSVIF